MTTPKKIAIVQSNYIPWKGYFDLIAYVDEFILYDDMQYTRRDWRNRNQIKTPQGSQWLTVPVKVKGKFLQTIRETEIDGDEWMQTHWKSISRNYSRTPHFQTITHLLASLYQKPSQYLSSLNRTFIEVICGYLGITTKISSSENYSLIQGKTERLIDLCLQADATEYVSGPSAKGYIDENIFVDHNIKLTWFDYSGYQNYLQPWGAFTHYVSIIDLLFCCGEKSAEFMKYVKM